MRGPQARIAGERGGDEEIPHPVMPEPPRVLILILSPRDGAGDNELPGQQTGSLGGKLVRLEPVAVFERIAMACLPKSTRRNGCPATARSPAVPALPSLLHLQPRFLPKLQSMPPSLG
ncbi:MAG: hypothetical protein J2P31_12945 [Blastocatellia bacterium]|nr:hypothetical protein [Blastocatellia bacterium]